MDDLSPFHTPAHLMGNARLVKEGKNTVLDLNGDVYKRQAIAVTAFQRELVISVLHIRLFVERSGEGSVDGSTGSFGHLHIFAEGESNGLSLRFLSLIHI